MSGKQLQSRAAAPVGGARGGPGRDPHSGRRSVPRALGVALLTVLLAPAAPTAAEPQPLTIAQAVDLALANNPALTAAEGRASAARAARDRADADRWPQLRLDSAFTHVSEVSVIQVPVPGMAAMPMAEEETLVAGATLQQLVFAGGRVTALVRQAEQGAEAARAAGLRARQAVAFGAQRAFLLLLAAQEETGVAARNLAAAESHLTVASGRFAARDAARFDVIRAEVRAEEARQEVIRADGLLLAARALLLQALGLESGEYRAAPVERPAAGAPRPQLEMLLDEAARLRPDLEALRRQVAAAEQGLRAAKAERLPTVAVGADYRWAEPESPTLFSRWTAGATLSLPVLDGGRITARCGEASAALVQAGAALDAQLRAVELEVRQAHARLATADAQVVVAARRVAQAEELVRLADVRFAGGVGTATEMADAQASLAGALHGATRAAAEQRIAEAELALAVGSTRTDALQAASAAPAAAGEGGAR